MVLPSPVCVGLWAQPQLRSFNLYAEYIIQNAWVDEAQARIEIAGRNMNNFRYADDTTLRAESEKELKNLLMKVKEESEKVGLKLSIQTCLMIQQSHCWAYTLRKPEGKETRVPQCSLQHCL